jgi:hypothetical protein
MRCQGGPLMRCQHSGANRMAQRAAAVGLSSVLLSMLMSCSLSPATSGLAQSTTQSQSGPGSTLASSTSTATASVHCSAYALPAGWTWYQDVRYPFRIAVPPQWRSGAFEYVPDGSDLGTASPTYTHVVDFFGPGSHGQAASNGMERFDTFPPVITIEVGVGSEARSNALAQNSDFVAQPTPVCLGSTPVTLYAFHGGEELEAVLPTGPQGYPCTFTVAGQPDNPTPDDQLFLRVLATYAPGAAG